MWIPINPNPHGLYVGDCVVRALSIAMRKSWGYIYWMICIQGFIDGNMPSANAVWENYLQSAGFVRYPLPDRCPYCYTVRDFCQDHLYGDFILTTGSHVIAVMDGFYFDAWDSGDEVPTSVWRRERYDW